MLSVITISRWLSLLLVFALMLPIIPSSADAEEINTNEGIVENELAAIPEVSVSLSDEELSSQASSTVNVPYNTDPTYYMDQIDSLLIKYLGNTTLSEEAIMDVVIEMPWDTVQTALADIEELDTLINSLPEATKSEINTNYAHKDTVFNFYDALVSVTTPVSYATLIPIEGVSLTNSRTSSFSQENGNVVVTRKVNSIFGATSSATATVTLNYTVTSESILKFDWVQQNSSNFTIDGTTYSEATGSFAKTVSTSGSFKITLSSFDTGSSIATLTMSNFSLVSADASFTYTIYSDSGEILVDGSSITIGDNAYSASFKAAGGTLAVSSKNFVAWVDSNTNEVLSEANPWSFKSEKNMNIRAVVSEKAVFMDKNKILQRDLNTAASVGGQVTLLNNGTLTAGTYTIPKGTILLIPHNSFYEYSSNEPIRVAIGTENMITPTSYRTLTMESGATLLVAGELNVSAKQYATTTNITGVVTDAYGQIKMENGSNITVQSGGTLCAWGYISQQDSNVGKGAIIVDPNGTVKEMFQVTGWRGGNATLFITDTSSYRVFPVSQYYVQNVEVPMTLHSGATEIVVFAVAAGFRKEVLGTEIVAYKDVPVPVTFVGGDSGMFQLSNGSITKDYDEKTDRLNITMHDGAKISLANIALSIDAGTTLKVNIDSKDYVMPIQNNLSIIMEPGSSATIKQDLALLPGAEISIQEGASVTLDTVIDGSRPSSIFVYDSEEWKNYAYHGSSVIPLGRNWTPGLTGTRAGLTDAKIIIGGEIDATAGSVYTTASGAAITGIQGGKITLKTPDTTAHYQFDQSKYDKDKKQADNVNAYIPIEINSAWLRNSDDSFTSTTGKTEPATFEYYNGKWCCHTPGTPVEENRKEPDVNNTGSYDSVTYCSQCGREISRTTETIPMLPAQASIGDTRYATLQEAIEDVTAGGTITLLADFTEAVQITKELTIDLNGHNILVTTDKYYRIDIESKEGYVILTKEPLVIAGKSLLFEDIIQIRYYCQYQGSDLTPEQVAEKGGILVWNEPQEVYDHSTAANAVDIFGLTVSNKYPDKCYVDGKGIPAKNMGDVQYTVFYIKLDDGSYLYSNVEQYSPRIYANNVINGNHTQLMKNVAVALMNYGAAAQKNFKYKHETDLMDDILTNDQRNWESSWSNDLLNPTVSLSGYSFDFNQSSDIVTKGLSLLFIGKIEINTYNVIPDSMVKNLDKMGILVWDKDDFLKSEAEAAAANSETIQLKLADAKVISPMVKNGSYYNASIFGTAAKELGNTYFVCAYVKNDEGTIQCGTVRAYGPHTYAANTINNESKSLELRNLCKTMVLYGDAAAKYFNEKSS